MSPQKFSSKYIIPYGRPFSKPTAEIENVLGTRPNTSLVHQSVTFHTDIQPYNQKC